MVLGWQCHWRDSLFKTNHLEKCFTRVHTQRQMKLCFKGAKLCQEPTTGLGCIHHLIQFCRHETRESKGVTKDSRNFLKPRNVWQGQMPSRKSPREHCVKLWRWRLSVYGDLVRMLQLSTKQSYSHGSGDSLKDRMLWYKQYHWKVRAARDYWSPHDSVKSPRYRTFAFS